MSIALDNTPAQTHRVPTLRSSLTVAAVALVAAAPLALVAPAFATAPTCAGKPATVVGTSGPDTITSDPAVAEVILGGAGDDEIVAHRGDVICGAAGNDYLGAVPAEAPPGPRVVAYGGDGNDTLGMPLHVEGYPTGSQVVGYGGPGDDRFPYAKEAYGGDGNDHLCLSYRSGQADIAHGGAGDDVLCSEYGSELSAGPGNDVVRHEAWGSAADVHVSGGDGVDTIQFLQTTDGQQSTYSVEASLQAGTYTAIQGWDKKYGTMSGFENIVGTWDEDVLIGNDRPNNLIGGGNGGDRIDGRGGYDVCVSSLFASSEGQVFMTNCEVKKLQNWVR